MAIPIILGAVGAVASIIGTFFVRTRGKRSPQAALNIGTFGAAILSAAIALPILLALFGREETAGGISAYRIYFSILAGMITGTGIGLTTEWFTGTGTTAGKEYR